jgi:hypothetical protein
VAIASRPRREPHHGSHILPVCSLALQQRAHRMRPLARNTRRIQMELIAGIIVATLCLMIAKIIETVTSRD